MNNDSNIKQIDEWEVLTPTGWQSFQGIKEVTKEYYFKLSLENGQSIKCSGGHQLFVKDVDSEEEGFLPVEVIEPFNYAAKTEKDGYQLITNIIKINEQIKLYDLVNVDNGYEYYTSGILSHNCAHIENLKELWTGLRPTLSTGGRAVVFSTPAGKGNFFHETWVDAEVKEYEPNRTGFHSVRAGANGFHAIKLPWTVHPERDDKWFEQESMSMDARQIAQELLCSFESSGQTFFNQNQIDYIKANAQSPIMATGPNGKGTEFWIWKQPQPGHNYLIAADVARGDSDDYSAFHVIDMTENEVHAEFMGRIPTDEYGAFLVEVGKQYNMALIAQEKNTFGVATANTLRALKYPNLYYESSIAEKMQFMSIEEKERQIPGFTTTPKNREHILNKLEEAIRSRKIRIYSSRFADEMDTFIWTGKRGQALKRKHDDLIMSLGIGLQIYNPTGGGGTATNVDGMAWHLAFLKSISRGSNTISTNPSTYGQNGANPFLQQAYRPQNPADIQSPIKGYNVSQKKLEEFMGVKLKPGVSKEQVKADYEFKKEFDWILK